MERMNNYLLLGDGRFLFHMNWDTDGFVCCRLVTEGVPAVNEPANLEDGQILISQGSGVYLTTSDISVPGDTGQAVDELVSLQPQ